MSDVQISSGFETCVRRLVEERTRPDYVPLYVTLARPEGAGGGLHRDDVFGPILGHCDYVPRSTFSTFPADVFAVAFHTPREGGFIRSERVNTLIRQTDVITDELQTLCVRLPERVRRSLCLPEICDWWRTLFHLAWHFDRPFLNSTRDRFLVSDGEPVSRVDETCIQQSGCWGRHDIVPGLIFGILKHDALTASEAAVGILLDSLRGDTRLPSGSTGADPALVFARLREGFRQLGEVESNTPAPKTDVKLLRFSDSFRTPPATEWASLEQGGMVESFPRLARINADQEFCQIRGPMTQVFTNLAREAGAALPPNIPAEATLFTEDRRLSNGFVTRISGPMSPALSDGATSALWPGPQRACPIAVGGPRSVTGPARHKIASEPGGNLTPRLGRSGSTSLGPRPIPSVHTFTASVSRTAGANPPVSAQGL
jgi:hypothetical protein